MEFTLLVFTGQLVVKLECYLSIKSLYIMIHHPQSKKNKTKKTRENLSLRKSNTYFSLTQAIGKV